jgi:predicted dehydrogenase
MPNIRLGVIGLGRMGQVYAYHVARQITVANLVAVADPCSEVTEAFTAQVSGVIAYADYHDLLNHPGLNGVIVATPISTHYEVVIAAAPVGKHIFCEKPTAITLRATDEMIAAAEKAGAQFMVGFMRGFDEGCVAAKRQIEAGVIGDPVMIRSIGRDPHRTSLEFANLAISHGLILDMRSESFMYAT